MSKSALKLVRNTPSELAFDMAEDLSAARSLGVCLEPIAQGLNVERAWADGIHRLAMEIQQHLDLAEQRRVALGQALHSDLINAA